MKHYFVTLSLHRTVISLYKWQTQCIQLAYYWLRHCLVGEIPNVTNSSVTEYLQDLSYKDRHWHEDCFHCFQCKRSLVDKPFSTKDEQLLCTECYSNEYSSKCHDCKKTIMPGERTRCGNNTAYGLALLWLSKYFSLSENTDTPKEHPHNMFSIAVW